MIDGVGDRKRSGRKRRTTARAVFLALGVIAVVPLLGGCTEEARHGARKTASESGFDRAESPPAGLATAEFRVDDMTCGGCALATEVAVRKLEGVQSVEAEYDESTGEGRCRVEFDPSLVETDEIAEAIRNAGFKPTLASPSSGSSDS